jgi:opine dehydrogenase
MKEYPNVTVCGCGSGAMAMAADLALMGCKVNLYEVSEYKENLIPIRAQGGIRLTGNTQSGRTGLATLNKITHEPAEALEQSELILLNVPAMAVEVFLSRLAPHFSDGQVVLVTTGYWASLRCREILAKENLSARITMVEEHIMPYLSRKTGPADARIYNYKRDIRIAAWPATESETAHRVIKRVYPQMRPSKNIVENNFQPGNPSVHAQINIPKAEFFFDRAREFRFYGEVSKCASRLADVFDEERRAVAAAFDCDTPSYVEWFATSYQYEGKDLYEICGDVSRPHTQRWGNDAGNRRVLKEDLCYFFLPMEQLARVVGIDVPVTTAMIEILSVFTDYDYRANGLTLKKLGLEGLDKEQIIRLVTFGQRD